MAGIGFRLQALLGQGTYTGLAKAYLFSAVIATGPWLLAIIGLGLLTAGARLLVAREQLQLFQAMVVFTYAGSLILTGVIQMGATRYIADRLYVSDMEALQPCYRFLALPVVALAGVVALAFLRLQGLGWTLCIGGTVLFQAVSLSWIGMLFLTAGKDYLAIVRAFAIGYAVGIAAALLLGEHFGGAGLIWGFALGQVVLVGLLGIRIQVEFPSRATLSTAVLGHLWKLWPLALVGLFYNAGIWLDNIVYWLGPRGLPVAGWLRISPRYDTCIFLAYLTIVPAMAQFMIRVEVAFYRQYAGYYACITQGATLDGILAAKERMIGALRVSAGRLVQLQGIVSILAYVFTPQLVRWLQLPPDHVPLLRICIIGAFVHVLFQIALVVVLYFDWQRSAALAAAVFALTQLLGALLTVDGDPRLHGVGYVAAASAGLLVCLLVLERRMPRLEYETFMRQGM